MLDFEARERFETYLRESMSQSTGWPIADAVMSAKGALSLRFGRGKTDAKNLIFSQKQILHVAEQYLQEKPSITYFAALKHIVFLKSKGVDSAIFDDFKDKEYVLEVEKYAEHLATSAEAMIDDETQSCLHELVILQQVEPLIPRCIASLEDAARAPLAERERILFGPEKTGLAKIFSNPSRHEWAVKLDKMFISAAAERLKQKPEDWIRRPSETIEYLRPLQERRRVLEDAYLKL